LSDWGGVEKRFGPDNASATLDLYPPGGREDKWVIPGIHE